MIALLSLLVLPGCGGAGAETTPAPSPRTATSGRATRVEVVTLEASTARVELDLPGEVGGDKDSNLAAANGGFVEQVLVEQGDRVSRGQVLARVDASLHAAQLELAEAQLAQAEADLKRVEALGDLGTPAQRQQAETGRRVAAANVSTARTRLDRAVIRAPFSGVVATVGADPGESVGPGTPILRVVQLDPAVINLSVSDRDVVSLQPDLPVTIGIASRPERWEGRIARVSPAADLRTRSFPVEVEVANPDGRLLPGMIARVTVERELATDAVVVPQDWIVTRRDDRGVFVVDGEVARWREITLGEVVHDRVVVLDGVAPGERIVVTGHRELVDGDPVLVSREGTCCAAGRPVFGAE